MQSKGVEMCFVVCVMQILLFFLGELLMVENNATFMKELKKFHNKDIIKICAMEDKRMTRG
jgi:hypothetical protein